MIVSVVVIVDVVVDSSYPAVYNCDAVWVVQSSTKNLLVCAVKINSNDASVRAPVRVIEDTVGKRGLFH